jgi:O-antigen/teichoic acid export membrane protein
MLGGIATLSSASAASRVIAALSTLLLAIWLPPAQFGYWAAANSAMAIAMAFVNFGEVNGYLSGHGGNFRTTRRSTLRGNLLLALVAVAIAVGYVVTGNSMVGILAFVIAATIPLVGDSDLLYAAGVKHKFFGRVTASQVLAAAAKLGIGVLVAYLTGSAIAIAISTLAYYIVIETILLVRIPHTALRDEPSDINHPPARARVKWAVNSFFMTLPIQVAFLVAQFLATPEVLGVFYLAFQASLAISGVLVPPISRVTLSTFAATNPDRRAESAYTIASTFGAALLFIAPTVLLLSPIVNRWLSSEWQLALPTAVLLLASLPMRIMGPILDAYQQSHNKWWQSTTFNVIDTALTGVAALTAISGNVLIMGVAISAAKLALGIVRTIWVFAGQSARYWLGLVLPVTAGSACTMVAVFTGPPAVQILSAASLLIGAVWLTISLRRARREAPEGRRGEASTSVSSA